MATCQVDRISIECEGGCGLICTATQCWSWCEPVTTPVVIPAVMKLRYDTADEASQAGGASEADEVPQGSTMLSLCANGATRRSLVHVLERMTGQRLVSFSQNAEDAAVEPFTGSLDDLLTHHGLRRDDS